MLTPLTSPCCSATGGRVHEGIWGRVFEGFQNGTWPFAPTFIADLGRVGYAKWGIQDRISLGRHRQTADSIVVTALPSKRLLTNA